MSIISLPSVRSRSRFRPDASGLGPGYVTQRGPPADRLRAQIDDVFAGGADLSRALERVARLGTHRLLGLSTRTKNADEILDSANRTSTADSRPRLLTGC